MSFNFIQVYFTLRKVDKITIILSLLFIMCQFPKTHKNNKCTRGPDCAAKLLNYTIQAEGKDSYSYLKKDLINSVGPNCQK